MTAPEFDVDALAAHRDALARVEQALAALQRADDLTREVTRSWWSSKPEHALTDDARERRLHSALGAHANAAMLLTACLADPEHGLTVETGVVHVDGSPCRHAFDALPDDDATWCSEDQKHLATAHGLVRDEPSEDERAGTWRHDDGTTCSRAFDLVNDDGWLWCAEHAQHATVRRTPARADDGRTAVERVTPGCPRHDEPSPCRVCGGDGYLAAADALEREGGYGTAPLRLRHLAARLRHDDGEADRGE